MNLQMKLKKILGIIVTLAIILTLNTSFSITFATDDTNNYVFGPMEMEGPNQSMVEKGKIINEIMYLWNTDKHTYNNMDFKYDRTYYIYDETFSNAVAPAINKSYLNLKVDGENKSID